MAAQILVDQKMEALECLYTIEAVSRLMQKAFESLSEAETGIYGSAVIIERNAKRLMTMLGES